MFTKTCKRCGLVVEYENEVDLKNHFYKKGSWYQGVCKDCDKKEHAEKYASGQYNYRKKRSSGGFEEYTFGNNLRCY